MESRTPRQQDTATTVLPVIIPGDWMQPDSVNGSQPTCCHKYTNKNYIFLLTAAEGQSNTRPQPQQDIQAHPHPRVRFLYE